MNVVLIREYVSLVVEKIRSTQKRSDHLGAKFDLNTFKKINNIEQAEAYANNFLQRLGKGSSRVAFLLSNRYVLKIAINDKGIAQNEGEMDVATNPKTKNVIARVRAYDPDYKWLISDVVKELKTSEEFRQLTDIPWDDFEAIMVKLYNKERVNKIPEFVQSVFATKQSSDISIGDMLRVDHWGKTPDGRCVILDYGLSNDVWAKHYGGKQGIEGSSTKTWSKKPTGDVATANTKDWSKKPKTPDDANQPQQPQENPEPKQARVPTRDWDGGAQKKGRPEQDQKTNDEKSKRTR